MGGGTLAWALRDSGAKVLLLERGDFLPSEPQNWSPEAVFGENRYKAGSSGATPMAAGSRPASTTSSVGTPRSTGLRCLDSAQQISARSSTPVASPLPGRSPTTIWRRTTTVPSGSSGCTVRPELTRPIRPRSGPFPFPPMPADPYMDDLAERFRTQGLHPAPLPVGLDYRPGGRCIRCGTCDAFPCRVLAKADADVCRRATGAGRRRTSSCGRTRWPPASSTDAKGERVTGVEI